MTCTVPVPSRPTFRFEDDDGDSDGPNVTDLEMLVSDLIGRPGRRREVAETTELDLMVGESSVRGQATVTAVLEGMDDGVLARFEVDAVAILVCTRCLTSWEEALPVRSAQIFEEEPDEDGYGLGERGTVDLTGPVRDEVALAIPVRPLCRPDCLGLCPTCGTDLNRNPCDGHAEPSRSPFAGLGDLLPDDMFD